MKSQRSFRLILTATTLLVVLLTRASAVAQPTEPFAVVEGADSVIVRQVSGWQAEGASAARIIARLYSLGYLQATGEIRDSVRVIIPGPLYEWEKVSLRGDSLALFETESLVGMPAASASIDTLLDRLRQRYEVLGYPDARIRAVVAEIDPETATAELILFVDSLQLPSIGEVRFSGSDHPGSLLRSVVALDSGTTYTPEVRQQVIRRLRTLELYGQDPQLGLYSREEGGYGLLVSLPEKRANRFDGILGFQPAREGEAGEVTGFVDIVLVDLFGAAERISGRWQRVDQSSSQFSLGYRHPYLFRLPIDASISFAQRREERRGGQAGFAENRLELETGYRLSPEWRLAAYGTRTSLLPVPDSQISPCDPGGVLRSSVTAAGANLTYDSRNNWAAPTEGIFYFTRVGVGAREADQPVDCPTEVGGTYGRTTLELQADGFLPLGPGVVLVGGLDLRDLSGDFLEYQELYRLGGTGSIRGYREEAIRASQAGWLTLEVRAMLATLSYAGVFVDGGRWSRTAVPGLGIEEAGEWIYGYGIAFQIETPAGVARGALSLGRGDGFGDAKVSLGLVTRF